MEKEVYKVTYHITGPDYSTDEHAMAAEVVDAVVEFDYDPDAYGNGYCMAIRSRVEPFGMQGYDIRYDKDFHKLSRIAWLANYFANRYDGQDGRWELIGIRVHEAEEVDE